MDCSAEVGAKERRGGFSLRPLREPSRPLRLGLGTVWLRLGRAVKTLRPLRLIGGLRSLVAAVPRTDHFGKSRLAVPLRFV